MKKILFVCSGNTCRSPMAEAILRDLAEKKGLKLKVGSAGVYAEKSGEIAKNSVSALKQLGYRVPRKKPRQLTEKMLEDYNLVLTMTPTHKRVIGGGKNVLTVAEFTGGLDVPDPYGLPPEAYLEVARQLEEHCKIIVDTLS